MKGLRINTILFGCVLIVSFIAGYPKVQQPRYGVADAYTNQGITDGKKAQQKNAISDFTEVIKANPKNANAYYNRGVAYLKKGCMIRPSMTTPKL